MIKVSNSERGGRVPSTPPLPLDREMEKGPHQKRSVEISPQEKSPQISPMRKTPQPVLQPVEKSPHPFWGHVEKSPYFYKSPQIS